MDKKFVKSLGKDTLLYIPSKIIPGLLGFFSLIMYTRLLKPEEYGRYTLVITIMSFLIVFIFSWLEQSVLRFNKKYEDNSKEFFSTILTVTVYLSIFLSMIYIVSTYVFFNFEYEVQILINLSAILLPLKVIYKIFMQIFRAKREAKFYSIISVILKFVYLFLTFIMIYFLGFREESMFFAFIITYIIFIFFQIQKLKSIANFHYSFNHINKSYLKKFFRYGSPWIGMAIGSFLLSKFDRYIINYFLNAEIVGIYSATYSLAENSIMQFVSLLSISTLPVLINSYEEDENDNSSLMMKELFKVYAIVFIPAIFGLIFLSKDIINIFLGDKFQGGNLVFIIISIGAFFEALRNLVGRPFQLKEKTIYLPFLLLISGAINLILNIVFVPILGMEGAAIATLIGYMFYFIIAYFISLKFFVWLIPWNTIMKSLISAIIMFLILYIQPVFINISIINLILDIFIGFTTYFIILYLFKEEIVLHIFNIVIYKFKERGKNK